ncbi:Histone H3/CENP-A like protein [Aduncisulcus paluster]|uniref:Histone H3/CENP-A like protein n=1 Tax=Aduncisulcus paluster TaxID=2918883 RepID=A0ABQ5JYL1_9EUKA|nr:Histone H3/CENP-A like protein [Aduncisulcus paluster]|eukprot:gnl/Carplike_NY0171/1744_a2355_1000.p1 GENE.gnl/Carplike_NY0171/1744_a2355_1000~~gnl/Carplike_NY0171/1744_a2355_1000.p1  ORF type:complete len:150 (+),score=38.55 gnl/Carplike_NY0171/1744_a2355_1000:70-519(+)
MARTKQTARKISGKAPKKSLAFKSTRTAAERAARKTTVPRPHVKRVKTRPGRKSIREIKHFQGTTDLLVPKAPFQRMVRSIALTHRSDCRFTVDSLAALQEATEFYLVQLLEDTNLLALHANRVTVFDKDLSLALRIRRDKIKEATPML